MTKLLRPARVLPYAVSCCLLLVAACEPPPNSLGQIDEVTSSSISNDHQFSDSLGTLTTYTTSTASKIDLTGPFFQSLGTNGRSCFSCHQYDQGWSISPASIQ